ncbi:MAG TPA: hypothetical protein VGJ55_15325, partial [Pyrinomonadaceae bacterium]
MRKELLKGFTVVVLTVALAFAAAVVSANAQSKKLAADIPFDFTVGNQTMTSGEYSVRSITNDGTGLVIKSDDTGKSVMRLSNSIEPQRNKTQARLVFHRYGQRYFLAEVWTGGDSEGRKLLESREERAIRHEFDRLARNTY